jgi:NDP-sugar pyrophosphorylase family protein
MSRGADWPALVLAAGLGTRLRPLSTIRAKPALPVAGRPLIVRILSRLRAAGVTRVVINLHHRAETITRVVGDGSSLGLQVRYSWEPEVLGSGGGPARAVPLLAADRFFILNGDTLSDVSFEQLARAHVGTGADVTLAVAAADLAKYSALVCDASDALVGIVARGSSLDPASGQRPWHFIGVQAVNAAAFAGVNPHRPADSLREIYPRLSARRAGSVRVCPADGAFYDIGTPDDYLRTVQQIAAAEGVPLDRGARTVIAASARVEHSVLWDDVMVNESAELSHCVVTDGVVIPPGARYHRAVITEAGSVPL